MMFCISDDMQYEIFTDPVTGKRYIKTEDGEILEIVVGEDGKTYVKTKSGKLRGEKVKQKLLIQAYFQTIVSTIPHSVETISFE